MKYSESKFHFWLIYKTLPFFPRHINSPISSYPPCLEVAPKSSYGLGAM